MTTTLPKCLLSVLTSPPWTRLQTRPLSRGTSKVYPTFPPSTTGRTMPPQTPLTISGIATTRPGPILLNVPTTTPGEGIPLRRAIRALIVAVARKLKVYLQVRVSGRKESIPLFPPSSLAWTLKAMPLVRPPFASTIFPSNLAALEAQPSSTIPLPDRAAQSILLPWNFPGQALATHRLTRPRNPRIALLLSRRR